MYNSLALFRFFSLLNTNEGGGVFIAFMTNGLGKCIYDKWVIHDLNGWGSYGNRKYAQKQGSSGVEAEEWFHHL